MENAANCKVPVVPDPDVTVEGPPFVVLVEDEDEYAAYWAELKM